MKKKTFMLLAAVLFNCLTGGMLAVAAGVSPVTGRYECISRSVW
jgi:hypothetical protein